MDDEKVLGNECLAFKSNESSQQLKIYIFLNRTCNATSAPPRDGSKSRALATLWPLRALSASASETILREDK